MRTTRMLSAAAILALTGCHFGMTAEKLPVANQPGGARVTVRTASTAYAGELIAVQNDGVVISNDRIMLFPFTAIAGLTVDKLGGLRLGKVEVPRGEKLAQLRAVSRFPQGLTPNIQSQLLAQKSQAEIVVVP